MADQIVNTRMEMAKVDIYISRSTYKWGNICEVLNIWICWDIFFRQTSYIMPSFSFTKNCITQLDHPPLPSAFEKGGFWYFRVVVFYFHIDSLLNKSLHKNWRRRGLSAWSMKTVRRRTKHLWLWLCDNEGQMFFSHTATLWAVYTTADCPLDNFLFLSVQEGP